MKATQYLMISLLFGLNAFGGLDYEEVNFIKAFKFSGNAGISRRRAEEIASRVLPKQFSTEKKDNKLTCYPEDRNNQISYSYDRDFIPAIPKELANFYATHNGGGLTSLYRKTHLGVSRVFFRPIEEFKRAELLCNWFSNSNDKMVREIFGFRRVRLNDYFAFMLDENSVDNACGEVAINLNPNSSHFGEILVISSSDDPTLKKTFRSFREFLDAMLKSGLQNWVQESEPSPTDFFNKLR